MSILVTPLRDRIICQYCSRVSSQVTLRNHNELLEHFTTHHRLTPHTCPCNSARALSSELEFRDHLKTCRLAQSLSSSNAFRGQLGQRYAILSGSKLQCPVCELEMAVNNFQKFPGHKCNASLDKIILGCRRYNPKNISTMSISAISSLLGMAAKKPGTGQKPKERKSLQFGMIFLKADNNFSCGLCADGGKEFTAWTSDKLGEHMRSVHPRPMDLLGTIRRCDEGGWVCIKCRASSPWYAWKFDHSFEVKRHLSNFHEGVITESKCLCGTTNFEGVEGFMAHLKNCPASGQILLRRLRGVWDGKRLCSITVSRINGTVTAQAVVGGIVQSGVRGDTLLP